MENKMEKLISAMKRSSMTSGEKARLKKELLLHLENNSSTEAPKLSPYQRHFGVPSYFRSYHFSFETVRKIGRAGAITTLSLFLVLGGITYASANALPGDLLYPIKINLREGIEAKLTFAPAQKIALLQKRINERFSEVEQLIKENKITPENRSIANSEIQVEKEQINSNIEAINKNNPEAAKQAKEDLQNSIDSRQEKVTNQIQTNQDLQSIQSNLSSFNTNLNEASQSTNQVLDESASATETGAGEDASATESMPGTDENSASSSASVHMQEESENSTASGEESIEKESESGNSVSGTDSSIPESDSETNSTN